MLDFKSKVVMSCGVHFVSSEIKMFYILNKMRLQIIMRTVADIARHYICTYAQCTRLMWLLS